MRHEECGGGELHAEAQRHALNVTPDEVGLRLDLFLVARLPALSRTQAQRLIKQGHVRTAAGQATARYRVRDGEGIQLTLPAPRPARPVAEDIPLSILYEDDDLVVIDKAAGMVVHPAPGHDHGTLVHALLFHCQSLSGIGGEERPGIVHRLDKDTTGLMVVAKHDHSHRHLSAQLQARDLQRRYLAVVLGRMPIRQGTIDAPIGRHPQHRQKMAVVEARGRVARTHYDVIETWGPLNLLRLSLETGRTHQIRVHLAHLGRAVIGDPVYGPGAVRLPYNPLAQRAIGALSRQALHAEQLHFQHPTTAVPMSFIAPVPPDMAMLLAQLRRSFGVPS